MKKLALVLVACATLFAAVSCVNKEKQPVKVTVQITLDDAALAQENVTVRFADASGLATYEGATDASGVASFKVPAGLYTATASFRKLESDGVVTVYSGSEEVQVMVATPANVNLKVRRIKASQVIIKEVYTGGAPKDATSAYTDDAYITLYNNSATEADLSDLVIGGIDPSTSAGTNKYYEGGALIFENEGWLPAYSAIWTFKAGTKLAPYSELVIALFGAINHLETYPNSVDLSNSAYYWMSKNDSFNHKKYQVSDNIPSDHYLSCTPINKGTAWVIGAMAPGIFIGKMSADEVNALITDKEAYDTHGMTCPKFPQDKVLDAIDGWLESSVESSQLRFPASINVGYVAATNKLGHSYYRCVDADATKALPENEGKLVYGYDAGIEGKDGDPSGIDAEASIAAGAHVIYSDTNNSSIDFHERAVTALKK